ncbi:MULTISPECIES: hypothetical protein [unclassified Sphingomonas]|uniref:hypothetical protein n=1 Tax=unclassified Sphingomonas TaxID=196159 RepID=UPI000E105609|nr:MULTISPECIES: hypothetical protein [unclassified Sphingomonas]AXJ94660.1 hypothetical protein DM480_03260 [Sphingomonas sp. FARSPH]
MSDLRLVPPPAPRLRDHYLVQGTVAPHFVEAGALTMAEAIAFRPADTRQAKELAAMVADGSIRTLGNGRFWFDIDAYEAAAAVRRRRRLPVILLVAIIVAVAALFFYRG